MHYTLALAVSKLTVQNFTAHGSRGAIKNWNPWNLTVNTIIYCATIYTYINSKVLFENIIFMKLHLL